MTQPSIQSPTTMADHPNVSGLRAQNMLDAIMSLPNELRRMILEFALVEPEPITPVAHNDEDCPGFLAPTGSPALIKLPEEYLGEDTESHPAFTIHAGKWPWFVLIVDLGERSALTKAFVREARDVYFGQNTFRIPLNGITLFFEVCMVLDVTRLIRSLEVVAVTWDDNAVEAMFGPVDEVVHPLSYHYPDCLIQLLLFRDIDQVNLTMDDRPERLPRIQAACEGASPYPSCMTGLVFVAKKVRRVSGPIIRLVWRKERHGKVEIQDLTEKLLVSGVMSRKRRL